jgi:putative nucleotidyltransferase with HDIG domain
VLRDKRFAAPPPTVNAYVVQLLERLNAHDPATHDHCRSVGAWSGLLAKTLNLEPDEVKAAVLAGTLHDIGKAATPLEILRKPGPLSGPEWEQMRAHAGDGAAMLMEVAALRSVAPIVRSHHELIDGRGYPDGLAGDRIPLLSRIVAVSDAFHAMIASRLYRQPLTVHEALEELRAGRGTQFDGPVVDAMLQLIAAKTQRASSAPRRGARAS